MKQQAKMGDIIFSQKEMKDALYANADGSAQSYVGLNDDAVNFGEAESFIDESECGKVFSVRVTNTSDKTQKLQLNNIIQNKDGYAIMKEGAVVEGLTVTGDPRSFDTLAAYIVNNPIRVRSIKLNVSDESQLDVPLKHLAESAFMSEVIHQVVPADSHDQKTTNTKTVDLEFKNWIISDTSTLLYEVRAGVSVNITFRFGASIDGAHTLKSKHARATRTAANYYARQSQKADQQD